MVGKHFMPVDELTHSSRSDAFERFSPDEQTNK